MGVSTPPRRAVLVGLGAMMLFPKVARAGGVLDLTWNDLLPEGQPAAAPIIPELLSHTGPDLSRSQPQSHGVRNDWDEKTVRIPGFVVPIEYSSNGVTAFILVPYAGACIHVPPPPANQLVFVTTQTPFESKGLYEPVNVTGLFGAAPLSTHLADIGYSLSADRIDRYGV